MILKPVNMKRKILVLVIIVSLHFVAKGQVAININGYTNNLTLINPASITKFDGYRISVGHNIGWLGMKKSPQTTYLSADGLLTDNMGGAISLISSQQGIFSVSQIRCSYMYRTQVASDHQLAFGVLAAIEKNTISTVNLSPDEIVDPTLSNSYYNRSNVIAGLGVEYSWNNLLVALSSPMFYNSFANSLAIQNYFYSQYQFDINETWSLKPGLLLRYTPGYPFMSELTAAVTWNSLVSMRLGFNTNHDFSSLVMVHLDKISFYYSYSMPFNSLSSITSGMHELSFSLFLKSGK
ncbi:type IX secretion system membrane protein PorP/SprF [Tenuifilum thalassicum]|uniref:Type IX secretion system membrane protein PorP/SprF n=2 Tax=Tenuifilum thalassicum TaxID=2590900 RepID=A0A7D4CQ24_9BACT|nr:type IX secretion system membrane protein PorP/SprF [Tenuifilum thalassicum]